MTIQYRSTIFPAFGFLGFNNAIWLSREIFEIIRASGQSTYLDKKMKFWVVVFLDMRCSQMFISNRQLASWLKHSVCYIIWLEVEMQVNYITQRYKYWTNKLALNSLEGWCYVVCWGFLKEIWVGKNIVDVLNLVPLLPQ